MTPAQAAISKARFILPTRSGRWQLKKDQTLYKGDRYLIGSGSAKSESDVGGAATYAPSFASGLTVLP